MQLGAEAGATPGARSGYLWGQVYDGGGSAGKHPQFTRAIIRMLGMHRFCSF